MGRWAAALAAGVLLAGCGNAGVAEDATVSAYVSAPLCAAAKAELARQGGRVDDLRLRAICVDDMGRRGDARLAAIGAAARQASEDSTTVAYIGTADRTAIRFSEPILEEAGIPRISARSGAAGMTELLRALEGVGDSGSLRESLSGQLG